MPAALIAAALLSVALGSTLTIPAAAQAATAAPSSLPQVSAVSQKPAVRRAAAPSVQPGEKWEFTGNTFQDNSAGLAACNTEGKADHQQAPGVNLAYECALSSPISGVYNLWLLTTGN
jgi:hypothetical protein